MIDRQRAELIAVDLSTGDRFTARNAGADPNFADPIDIVAGGGQILILDDKQALLFSLTFGGDRTLLSGAVVGSGPGLRESVDMALDAAGNRALVIAFDGETFAVVAVDLTTGNRTPFSDFGTGAGPGFEQPTHIALDAANGRAVVVDDGSAALLGVELASGNRSVVSDSATGSGPILFGASALLVDAGNNQALIADRGIDALLVIDLASGDRTPFSDIQTGTVAGPNLLFVTGLDIDNANNRVLALDGAIPALVGMARATGDRTFLSGAGVGSGPELMSPTAMVTDATNNRVLIADQTPTTGTLLGVALASGIRSTVSGIGAGTGPDLAPAVVAAALDSGNNRALLLDASLGAVIAVDLVSGDRAIISR